MVVKPNDIFNAFLNIVYCKEADILTFYNGMEGWLKFELAFELCRRYPTLKTHIENDLGIILEAQNRKYDLWVASEPDNPSNFAGTYVELKCLFDNKLSEKEFSRGLRQFNNAFSPKCDEEKHSTPINFLYIILGLPKEGDFLSFEKKTLSLMKSHTENLLHANSEQKHWFLHGYYKQLQ
ncbi:MAG: hypothetical protein JW833_11225 [Prolixibacteraceae bacterium]|nr:hypothetical protein [Prolixibacteraceae bacterium]